MFSLFLVLIFLGTDVGSCSPVTIGAVILPKNRFVQINWKVQATHADGTEISGAVPSDAQESADLIRYKQLALQLTV